MEENYLPKGRFNATLILKKYNDGVKSVGMCKRCPESVRGFTTKPTKKQDIKKNKTVRTFKYFIIKSQRGTGKKIQLAMTLIIGIYFITWALIGIISK